MGLPGPSASRRAGARFVEYLAQPRNLAFGRLWHDVLAAAGAREAAEGRWSGTRAVDPAQRGAPPLASGARAGAAKTPFSTKCPSH